MSYNLKTLKGYYQRSNITADNSLAIDYTNDKDRAHVFDQYDAAMHFDWYLRRNHGATMTKIEKVE